MRHPAFVNAMCETARHRMPAYKPPSYNAIRSMLLAAKKKNLDKQMKEKLGNSIDKYDVTLCCDGWGNVQNRPLLNMVQCGTKGDIFLGTINTTGNHKDHTYVSSSRTTMPLKPYSKGCHQISPSTCQLKPALQRISS